MMSKYRVLTVSEIKERLRTQGARFEVVSLFAGGGGSSCGYRMAGGKVLAINEFVEEARNSYHANWPDTHIFSQDIRELTGQEILDVIGKKNGELDILDGSPPCSAFSIAGKREKLWGQEKKYSDTKQKKVENLFFEFVRILRDVAPKCFVAENVKGLTVGVARGFLNEFFAEFDKAGYIVRAKILDAKWLGVPQSRPRLIFVGVRKDLWRDEFDGLTHPRPNMRVVTLKEAFSGVSNTPQDIKETDCKRFAIYNELVLLPYGGTSDKYFNLVKGNPNDVSNCITATIGCLSAAKCMHWDNRAYTIPELKRIASVPDDYILTGTYSQRAERLGRMVPPLMMKAVADNLYANILSKLK